MKRRNAWQRCPHFQTVQTLQMSVVFLFFLFFVVVFLGGGGCAGNWEGRFSLQPLLLSNVHAINPAEDSFEQLSSLITKCVGCTWCW